MIRVLLVDDSQIALAVLKKMLTSADSGIEIIGTAENGEQGLKAALSLHPDVICTDYYMPIMNGLEFTRQVMALCPTPILILSIAVQQEQQNNVFQLLEAGAVDVLAKPSLSSNLDSAVMAQALINKIRLLSGVKVFKRQQQSYTSFRQPQTVCVNTFKNKKNIIVIGASTGGPQILENIFSCLPSTYPFTIICIQHISSGFLDSFIDWLNSKSKLPVSIAKNGEIPQKQHIYFAPDNANLFVNQNGHFQIKKDEQHFFYPSIDETFMSVSKQFTNQIIGILLTGMGSDGAKGLKLIADAGGLTIAQDEASCSVFGMPKAAIELGAAKKILNADSIIHLLCHEILND